MQVTGSCGVAVCSLTDGRGSNASSSYARHCSTLLPALGMMGQHWRIPDMQVQAGFNLGSGGAGQPVRLCFHLCQLWLVRFKPQACRAPCLGCRCSRCRPCSPVNEGGYGYCSKTCGPLSGPVPLRQPSVSSQVIRPLVQPAQVLVFSSSARCPPLCHCSAFHLPDALFKAATSCQLPDADCCHRWNRAEQDLPAASPARRSRARRRSRRVAETRMM